MSQTTTGSPPTVDLFYLTFNAGKAFISSSVFAKHIYNAFKESARGADSLPELVAFSLQETSPLADAFRGPYFMNPYFSCYESALNLAAARYIADEEREHRPKDTPYTLVKTSNVSMTGIMLFARDPTALSNIKAAEVGFGAGDMANKGAVGLRLNFSKDSKVTELTFVSAHLAAMEWNLERRNKNWASLVSGLVFDNPRHIVDRDQANHGRNNEAQPLLFHPDTEKQLHDISIYKPGSHLFVAGDLNYRLSKTSPPSDAVFPAMDPDSVDYYPRFLSRDQLMAERRAGRTLHGLSEASIRFPPTYKLNISKTRGDGSTPTLARIAKAAEEDEEVEWTFATHRWPGWCDRVLYLDTPGWVDPHPDKQIKVMAYNCLPAVRTSDHRAVYLRAQVPVLSSQELTPPDNVQHLTPDGLVDPRIKLPVAIEPDAWEHREAVKKWEYIIGWSLAMAQSKQSIIIVTTVLLVGLSAWWFTPRSS
ncbi:putative Endonuclease/exonuclease/phosphatase [Seiridium cardinale]|uniref:Endonuclease/exonuclease/phosphatase n=1 Tax=Seiridium cardinale TaxID=138064 RepID=A0ABR2Y5I3_9PEZI